MQLALDQWELRSPDARRYRRAVTTPLRAISRNTAALQDVRAQAGPPATRLPSIIERWRREGLRLDRITPPAAMQPIHALFRSAWAMAEQAFTLRLSAAAGNDAVRAQQASSAAAGALMLLGRARADLDAALDTPDAVHSVITPRRTRLLRVPSLRGMQDVLTGLVSDLDLETAADTFVVVPTRAAGEQLRRTVEDRLLQTRAVMAWPSVGPRADLYRELASRAPRTPPPLSEFDREVLLARVAREVTAGRPRAALRPPSVARRRDARALRSHPPPGAHARGLRPQPPRRARACGRHAIAARPSCCGQTAFLTAVFTAYERQLARPGRMRRTSVCATHLLAAASPPTRYGTSWSRWPIASPMPTGCGRWTSRCSRSSRALARVDVIATEALLASGFLERVHAALPGLDEVLDAGAAVPHVDRECRPAPGRAGRRHCRRDCP